MVSFQQGAPCNGPLFFLQSSFPLEISRLLYGQHTQAIGAVVCNSTPAELHHKILWCSHMYLWFNKNHAGNLLHFKTVELLCSLGFMCVCVWVGRWDSCWWCNMIGWNMNNIPICHSYIFKHMNKYPVFAQLVHWRHLFTHVQCSHPANWLPVIGSVLFVVTLDDFPVLLSHQWLQSLVFVFSKQIIFNDPPMSTLRWSIDFL